MIISLNWLKKFTEIDLPIDELATLIGARLVEIESITNLSEKYKDVVIVKVVECSPLEGSDHLNVTKIDDAGVAKGVERDDKGLVQVVCGAPNVRAGMMTAWLPPSSTVPETFGTSEPFILTPKDLRGTISNGMLASAKELDLFDDHSGILEVDDSQQPGTKFVTAYQLDDYLLDIENKSLTHRPDTFGMVGFAREVAGISGKQFKTPEFLQNLTPKFENDGTIPAPTVTIDDPALSDRYQAIVLSGARPGAMAPLQIQTYLSRVGVRPINAIVDVTNLLMMTTGQPLHAFDYDKLVSVGGGKADIHVRSGREGEKLDLLDGRTVELSSEDIVIASGDTPIALAGAMGGSSTAIDENTKNIIIESATFDLYHLRSTQMRHGIFSEAITRFTKGQPAELTAPVLAEAVQVMGEFADAKPVSPLAEAYPGKKEPITLDVNIDQINAVLGTKFSVADAAEMLQNVEFNTQVVGMTVKIIAPYWRQDIHINEDIIEEVGRLNGFDEIELTLPTRDFTAVEPSDFDQLRSEIRSLLVRAGANEVLTYSFVHGDIMQKVGQNQEQAYRITNSISPDLQFYRQSILPSLMNTVHGNVKSGYDHFALFEFNKFHTKKHDLTDEKVPLELDSLAFMVVDSKNQTSAAYFEAKRYLDYLADSLHLEFVYEPLESDSDYPVTQPFEPIRSARVWDKKTRERVGVIGEFKRSVIKSFKLPDFSAGFEISPRILLKLVQLHAPNYTPLSKFPSTLRDICFQVANDITYQQLIDAAQKGQASSELEINLMPIDIYQPENGATKNITIRITFTAFDHTLKSEEATVAANLIIDTVVAATAATVI